MGQVLKVRRNGTGKKAARCAARGGDSPRVSLYDEVTAKIIAQLEAGCFPWAQPWSSAAAVPGLPRNAVRSEEHTSELQSLMRISYAVFCLKKKKNTS